MHGLKFTTHKTTLLPMHAEKDAFSSGIFNYNAINCASVLLEFVLLFVNVFTISEEMEYALVYTKLLV